MKRLFAIVLPLGLLFAYYISTQTEGWASSERPVQLQARAAIMLDADTGRVLYEFNADTALPPASMSKMMTELLLLEDVRKGKAKWDEPVKTSRYAADVTGSQAGFKSGDTLTLRQMFQAIAIQSANDAAVAVAEHLAGSESAFVDRMNRKVKELGLSSRAYFANASGLPLADLGSYAPKNAHKETLLTSRDTALLARALIQQYPEALSVTRQSEVVLPASKIKLTTTNELLDGQPFAYPGVDGFKTGFTDAAGYCFTGTAERGGKRLITVVMGTETPEARFTETAKLLDYGFRIVGKVK
ncbi:D-alanyl-D-alanine carboxypeptidase family protein [Paenibacillus sp. HJGM_3]|uniref:D-alanyl-D-alanine carboxypeptidase family protein n=1 Tax=Paenibacillus sp. HJGM_3 TaxID=3379816 RepID=UPI00385A5A03